MTRAALDECLDIARAEGRERDAQDAEKYVNDLETKLRAARKALRKIAEYADGKTR